MPGVVVVGAQWGDEGKGKIVDILTEHAQVVVRYAGGPNAGHTLVVGNEKVIVRLVPSGILRKGTTCVLAQGMVIDPVRLCDEIDELKKRGYEHAAELSISDRAHAILSYHRLVDGLREQGAGAIGTTKRGIGPCYEDKAARRGVPMGALRDVRVLRDLAGKGLEAWKPVIAALGGKAPSIDEVLAEIEPLAARLAPRLCDTTALVNDALRAGKSVLFEGAQGTLLDVDHGTYPFVTSSSAIAGGACTGAGVGPTRIGRVVGLVKAYCTRVGGGPFPTELSDEVGERLRKVGDEFGSVTGRPRRTGWLDLPALRYAARINGLDRIAITKLDVLTGLPKLRVCVAYETPRGRSEDFPTSDLDRCKPVFRDCEPWSEDLAKAKTMGDLPRAAQEYVKMIEEAAGCEAAIVSVGSRRDETILRSKVFD
ncbi:MAG TPA: adenylosuccinate synthase [Polyangiaceae bacterium]|jgi:adenylosuccinate synthase